ncbi:hypothetical protein L596_021642 [Steinernema carpocapsae]|uniref:Retinoid-inducible serine carboxypeptidase n=1 Tax=Steinernema carpocapsae TaxID=34508 RepID=A0A4U5MJC0_STECR|nr:hypothetical protein L596_021642 [Steinernema carpocapsae]
MRTSIAFALLALSASAFAAYRSSSTVHTLTGNINYREDWGYVDVRSGAHSFWWLYAAQPANNRPLILWLQGGPGASSSGFGNIEEIGPKTLEGSDRNYTWLQYADLVFIDNPVGTGFSYVDSNDKLTTNVQQIGQDLLSWAHDFFSKSHPEYQSRPFYIFCESYGGKMSAEFAKVLTDEISAGKINVNFKAVALGDSWISAMDFVNTWGPYLHTMSYLDDAELTEVNAQANQCQKLCDSNKWSEATECWNDMENLVGELTDGVSWYNILKRGNTDNYSAAVLRANRMSKTNAKENLFNLFVKPLQLDALSDYMNTVIRAKLKIIPNKVSFGGQSGDVFSYQYGDFMKPNYATVDALLKSGKKVVVYNGQMDLICDTLGVEKWINRLTWSGLRSFQKSEKTPFHVNGEYQTAGFFKEYQNFSMFYLMRAGHMLSYDTPLAAIHVVKEVLKN